MDNFAYFNSILHFTQASLNLENHRVFRCVRYEVDRLTIYALDIPVILSSLWTFFQFRIRWCILMCAFHKSDKLTRYPLPTLVFSLLDRVEGQTTS
jgi:hypothetical protein